MKIAYLGPNGSFTHNVALTVFTSENLISYSDITSVIKAFEDKEVDYAIVPVENSIEGSVHETIDYLFHRSDLHALCEIIQPIKQCLLTTDKNKQIDKVYSHPQAIAQSKAFLKKHYPDVEFEVTASTSYAAQLIAKYPEKPYAAIAPLSAKDEYHLEVVAKDIQEIDGNYTRFWVFGRQDLEQDISLTFVTRKLSLGLTLPDNLPGALYKALSVFAWRSLDLTKIESRPLKTALGEYFFILDLVSENSERISYALEELTSLGIEYKILGQYSVYAMPDERT